MRAKSTSKSTSTAKSVGSRVHRAKHPGVVILKPDPARRIGWRARFVDPDSGRTVKVSLEGNADQREDWCVRQSAKLKARRIELERGATRASGMTLSDAIDRFFAAHPTLRPRTVEIYRVAARRLLERAPAGADDLTRGALVRARASLVAMPKQAPEARARRGRKRDLETLRKPASINADLRAWKRIVNWMIDAELVRVSHDDVRRALKREALVSADRIDYRRPAELRALVRLAIAHDRTTYKETRAEHASREGIGTTPRHAVRLAPLLCVALLSGLRASELRALEWVDVESDEIRVHRTASSTKRARVVDFQVSPALGRLLEALRPRDAKGRVFTYSREEIDTALARLGKGANMQALRRTCATYLICAPGIYGAASAFLAAKRMGHSVAVSERHYAGVLRGIPATARTLEAAMGIASRVELVTRACTP